MVYIANQSLDGNRVKVGEVAENSELPKAFTAKLLGILSKADLIHSQTGPNGGFFVEIEKVNKIKLSEIIQLMDGDSVFNGCGLGLKQCDAKNPCPMHHYFVKIRAELKYMLETTSIYDLAMKLKTGESVLIREIY